MIRSVFLRLCLFVFVFFAGAIVYFGSGSSASAHGVHRMRHHRSFHHHHHQHHYRHYGWVGRHASRAALNANAMVAPERSAASFGSSFGGSSIVATARQYIGGNPTGRASLWCGRFMNLVLQRSGYRGTGSDMARSFAGYGHRLSGPQVGAIAVMSRRGGGHVGVVSGIDANGNPIIISGNHGHRVAEAVYPRSRIYAYVTPSS